MNRRCAAMHMRSSKYGSTFRYCPLPPWSPRCMWTSATSSVERGHRDELLAVGVGRAHRAQVRVDAHDVGTEPDTSREERNPPRRGLQPEEEHALVELGRAAPRPTAAALRKCGSSGIESSDTNAYTTCFTLPARQSRPTSGPPYETTVRSFTVRAAQRADEGHRLAPRSPAADADGHAVADLADDVVDGHAFVGNRQRVAPRGRAGF